jgi:hypothetical protein
MTTSSPGYGVSAQGILASLTHQAITTALLKIKANSTPGILGISKSRKWTTCKAT